MSGCLTSHTRNPRIFKAIHEDYYEQILQKL
jgi:hypothetical protein